MFESISKHEISNLYQLLVGQYWNKIQRYKQLYLTAQGKLEGLESTHFYRKFIIILFNKLTYIIKFKTENCTCMHFSQSERKTKLRFEYIDQLTSDF